ncbi:hypothetical protein HDU81_004771 [Chytriomyces hyalinus]|nr:hypothetical protein HDU81_004771 [Chytriomyces hyalinus]
MDPRSPFISATTDLTYVLYYACLRSRTTTIVIDIPIKDTSIFYNAVLGPKEPALNGEAVRFARTASEVVMLKDAAALDSAYWLDISNIDKLPSGQALSFKTWKRCFQKMDPALADWCESVTREGTQELRKSKSMVSCVGDRFIVDDAIADLYRDFPPSMTEFG